MFSRIRTAVVLTVAAVWVAMLALSSIHAPATQAQGDDAITGLIATGPSSAVAGTVVEFSVRVSSGTNIEYTWDFGDGTGEFTTTEPTVPHVYTAEGTYTVTVIASNTTNQVRSTTSILITPPPVDDLLITAPPSVVLGTPAVFSSIATSPGELTFRWDFGDGTQTEGAVVEHVYARAGNYIVSVTASNGSTRITTSTQIEVNPPAIPPFEIQVSGDFVAGGMMTFTADTGGTADRYSWDFGDGETQAGPEAVVTYVYNTPGRYTVAVNASNEVNNVIDTQLVFIVAAPGEPDEAPEGLQIVQNGPGVAGQPVAFAAALEEGTNLQYQWNFGDGNTGEGPVVVNTYEEAGQYAVMLTVSNSEGRLERAVIADIQESTRTEAQLNVLINGIDYGDVQTNMVRGLNAFQFAIEDPDSSIVYEWDFGDGGRETGPSVTYTYETPGAYVVTVEAITSDGTPEVTEKIIVVAQAQTFLPLLANVDSPSATIPSRR